MEEDKEAAEAAARVQKPSPRRRMEPSRSDSGHYDGRNYLKATKIGPLSKSAENYSLDSVGGRSDPYDPLSITSSISLG